MRVFLSRVSDKAMLLKNFESEAFRGRVSFKMEATVMLPTPFQLFFFWATALGLLEHVCYQKDW